MKRLGTHKDVEKKAREMRKEGWVFELSKNNRIQVKAPGESHVSVTGSQNGSERSRKIFLRDLAKAQHDWSERHPVEAGLVDLPYKDSDG